MLWYRIYSRSRVIGCHSREMGPCYFSLLSNGLEMLDNNYILGETGDFGLDVDLVGQ